MAVYRVYISSTRFDLPDHMTAAREAVLRLGMLPMMNDHYGMVDSNVVEQIESQIGEADIFLGIYAHQYGRLVNGTGVSTIEREYDHACRLNKPRLLFFVHPEASWPAHLIERGEGMSRLEEFQRRVMDESQYNTYTTPPDLMARVFFGLHETGMAMHRKDGLLEVKPIFGAPSRDPQFRSHAFMIMPFADKFRAVFTDHIRPTVEQIGVTIKRGDEYFSENSIISEIWSAIYQVDFVIVECTDRNPNVYYELGIAHTVGKPSILLTQDINDIPFDLRHLRIIEYKPTPEGLADLSARLTKACEWLLAEMHSA